LLTLTFPYITVYSWGDNGFRGVYSLPDTTPTGTGINISFSFANDAIAVSHVGSPYISVYPWSGSGFGTKFANPAALPGTKAME
jgi:hypothetical protein